MKRYFANNVRILSGFLLAVLALFAQGAFAQPFLAFSDLVSGPSTGLGDGKGSGVVVTVWGQGLGASQSDSQILYRTADGEALKPAYVYYWKNADGKLPSGPANLFESHRMQEIAFSIPEAPAGRGEIIVRVDGIDSNALPFTVRSGNIYHVKGSGSNKNDGSWSAPFAGIDYAVNAVPSGSTIYVHDVDAGSFSNPGDRAIYWNNSSASSTLDAQFTLTAYPGFQPKAIAQRGVESYQTEGWVVSKLDVYASNYLSVDSNGQPRGDVISSSPRATYGIQLSKDGRAVANRIGDIPGGCASQAQGAILGNKSWVGNNKIFGNEIYDYGCEGSDKLHHTTYLSIRSSDDPQVEPWEWGYNYLHGNHAKFGIHNYDEGDVCGDVVAPLKIYKNVIVDQGGAGISVGSACGWSMDVFIEDNVLINVGLAAAWDGVDPASVQGPEGGGIALRDASLLGTFYISNNLIYRWSTQGLNRGAEGCLSFNSGGDNLRVIWANNICYSELDLPFVAAGFRAENKLDNVDGSHNLWFKPNIGEAPAWDVKPVVADPRLEVYGAKVTAMDGSPIFGSGVASSSGSEFSAMISETLKSASFTRSRSRDIYGNIRSDNNADIGPLTGADQIAAPLPPTGVSIE